MRPGSDGAVTDLLDLGRAPLGQARIHATLHVLRGRARPVAGGETGELSAGRLGPIPPRRHSLHADEDTVVLLGVVHG
ncbi:hypothetical protein ACWKWC_03365 [Geodermatophilus nigrescens]